MGVLESLEEEVQGLADDRLESILVKLLASLSEPTKCEQRKALRDYVEQKIALHRAKKTYRRIDMYGTEWMDDSFFNHGKRSSHGGETYWLNKVVEHTNRAAALRRRYYESECGCGSCRSQRASQKLKFCGAQACR